METDDKSESDDDSLQQLANDLLLDDLSNFFLDDDLNHNVQYEEEI
jgi:hypothetical protein